MMCHVGRVNSIKEADLRTCLGRSRKLRQSLFRYVGMSWSSDTRRHHQSKVFSHVVVKYIPSISSTSLTQPGFTHLPLLTCSQFKRIKLCSTEIRHHLGLPMILKQKLVITATSTCLLFLGIVFLSQPWPPSVVLHCHKSQDGFRLEKQIKTSIESRCSMQSVTTVLPLVLLYLRGQRCSPLAFSGSDGNQGNERTGGAWWRKSCIAGLATDLTQEWTN